MGTLGRYLQDARNERGIDLREAAQQTRISIQYLQALESEDFSKLPGEVFVRGFLKNYGKFLSLDESEVMKRYGELRQKPAASSSVVQPESSVPAAEKSRSWKLSVEPFIWAAGIIIVLVVFLFTALPVRHPKGAHQPEATVPAAGHDEMASAPVPTLRSDKLYLEIVALDNTWVLVRTDSSPQKKAVLNKGESLIWSADERFLLSYGSAGAIKLVLNGQELTVNEPKNVVIRDLVITAQGIENPRIQPERARPIKPITPPADQQAAPTGPAVHAQQNKPPSRIPHQSLVSSAEHSAPSGTQGKKSPPAKPKSQAQQNPPSQVPHQSLMSSGESTASSGTVQNKLP
jgi:transcriptional regulator with XRE-family HTH domain